MEGDDVSAQLELRVVARHVGGQALAVVMVDGEVQALHSQNRLPRFLVNGEVQQRSALAGQGQLAFDEHREEIAQALRVTLQAGQQVSAYHRSLLGEPLVEAGERVVGALVQLDPLTLGRAGCQAYSGAMQAQGLVQLGAVQQHLVQLLLGEAIECCGSDAVEV